jgi:hypothetical protein
MIEVAGRIHAAVGFDPVFLHFQDRGGMVVSGIKVLPHESCLFLRFSMRSCAPCILVALSFAVCACWATCLFYFRNF